MVIIKLWGGLGNQLFQYALYLSYREKNINCKLDKSVYQTTQSHNGYELERIFNIDPQYASAVEKLAVKPISKLRYKFFNYPYDEKKWGYGYYNNRIPHLKFGYLKGYWQTEKYFKQVENKIREAFQFPALTDEANKAILKKIKETNAVSLHIRRGDYLLNDRDWSIDIAYYKNAVVYINQKVQDPFFYIFSDDIEWARENIKEPNIEFIDWNKKENSYRDMQLMSNCLHNIIANSSFSWWGAWLNPNQTKIVIAPDNWAGMEGTRNVVPKEWIQLPVQNKHTNA